MSRVALFSQRPAEEIDINVFDSATELRMYFERRKQEDPEVNVPEIIIFKPKAPEDQCS